MLYKNILLTGASGFLGKYIYAELQTKGNVVTVSRTGAAINADLATDIPNLPSAELVVHCAGKAHSVPKTDIEKQAFFDVNFKGTLNLLKGIEQMATLPKSFVLISTVAVYGCDEGRLISEDHPLDAQDAYGKSKIQAEELVKEWCIKHNVIFSILRLPLLFGENPPGNLGAMIKGIKKGYYFNIAGGKTKKSMVLAKDIASIISIVAPIGGIYNLTDGEHPSFEDLSKMLANNLNKKKPMNIPFWLAKTMAIMGDIFGDKVPINSNKLKKVTTDLTFDDDKARRILNWKPNPVLREFKV